MINRAGHLKQMCPSIFNLGSLCPGTIRKEKKDLWDLDHMITSCSESESQIIFPFVGNRSES